MSFHGCTERCEGYCLMFKGINCRYITIDEFATLKKIREDTKKRMIVEDEQRRSKMQQTPKQQEQV